MEYKLEDSSTVLQALELIPSLTQIILVFTVWRPSATLCVLFTNYAG